MEILASDVVIAYEPLGDEANFRSCPFLGSRAIDFIIGQDKHSDPLAIAAHVTQEFHNKKVWMLLPGQQFDKTGTRHGRGFGWYDRLLSRVPKEWMRIGVLHAHQLEKNLIRAAHDEAVDYLWVFDGARWDAVVTKAR